MAEVKRINTSGPEVVSELLKLPYNEIGCVNWTEYPYKPSAGFRIGYSDEALAILFEVEEENIRAVTLEDCGPVWEDSCCEFFVANPCGEGYFNFELNCIGTLLAAKRKSRTEFDFLSAEQLGQVRRYSSLPHEAVDAMEPDQKYWVAEVIPFSLLGLEKAPESLRVNIYKCGDLCRTPHFLSHFPIGTSSPDFHCPEFFREIRFV